MPRKTLSDWSQEDLDMVELDLKATIAAQGPKDILGYALQAIQTIRNEKEPGRKDEQTGGLTFTPYSSLRGDTDILAKRIEKLESTSGPYAPSMKDMKERIEKLEKRFEAGLEHSAGSRDDIRQALLALEDAQGHVAGKVTELEEHVKELARRQGKLSNEIDPGETTTSRLRQLAGEVQFNDERIGKMAESIAILFSRTAGLDQT